MTSAVGQAGGPRRGLADQTASVASVPTFSVVIPAYNAARTVETAVRSALDQTFPALEIIVVDDGSHDDTAGVISAIGPRVTFLRQANRGVGQARNTGAKAAAGDWVAFLDADDAWLPQKLERQAPFTGDPRVAVVNCRSKDKAGKPLPSELSFDDLWRQNDVITSSSLVRRSAFEAAGGFGDMHACEDYHLWLRLAAAGWVIANCPEDLVIYSPAPGSLTQQLESFAAAEIACIRDVASRVGVPSARLRPRLIAGYLSHARGAIYSRNLDLARTFIRQSFLVGVSAKQFWMLGIASTPAALLDLRRRLRGI